MAKCQVKYNRLGQISQVLDSNGNVSELYNTIASHPFVETKEEALNIYKNIYTDKIDESSLFTNRTKYGYTSSYKEALDEVEDGEVIEVGFYSDKFYPIKTIEVSTDTNTVNGFVNAQIKNNLLSDQKVVDPDGTFFKAKGNTAQTRAINTAQLEEELKLHVGLAGYKRYEGNKYTINAIKPKEYFPENSVESKIAQSLADSGMMRAFGKEKETTRTPLSENELKIRLLNLLSDLGVKVTSISDYIENYSIKNGVDPSASALADIANKVVAFQGGEITVEQLSEETAHFIVEALPQEQIEDLLRNIHKTKEWAEHSQTYRDIYSNEYSEAELEEAVRREVLGKVLSNSLQNNFSTENNTSTQSNIIGKLKELFNNFIERVRSFFKPQYRTQLENFTNQVQDLLLRDQLGEYLSPDKFKANKFRFYQVTTEATPMNKIRGNAKAVIESLKRQINDLSKVGKPTGVSRQQLKRATEELETQRTEESIATFLEVSRQQIKYINNALDNSQKDKYHLAQEEVSVFQSLVNEVRPILEELRVKSQSQKGGNWKTIEDTIKSQLDDIGKINGREKDVSTDAVKNLVDRIKERHNLSDEFDSYINDWLESAKSDTSYFHATFGQMVHAQDPLLGMSGVVIQDTQNEANIKYTKAVKDFQKRLKELGIKESDLDVLQSDGYLIDEVDHAEFQKDIVRTKMQVFKDISKTDLSLDELVRRYNSSSTTEKNSLPELPPEQQKEYAAKSKERIRTLTESPMSDQYYKEKKEKYEKNNISKDTQEFLASISADRAAIVAEARREDGTIDLTMLSDFDLKRLQELKRIRKKAKSPFNKDGIKTGLKKNKQEGVEYILDDKVEPSTEGRIAADLMKLDELYKQENGVGRDGIPDIFMQNLEASEDPTQFLRLNSVISFSQDFWDSFGRNMSLMDRLESLRDSQPTPEDKIAITEIIENINTLSEKRKNILKIYRNPNNPAETDTQYMEKEDREEIKNLTSELNQEYKKAFRLLKDTENEIEDSEVLSEMTTNEAYSQALEDENRTTVKEELEFIKKHTTKEDLERIRQMQYFLNDYTNGLRDSIPIALRRYVENNVDLDEITKEDVEYIVRDYAKTKLLPYYKRIAPSGYNNLISGLENGTISPKDFINIGENYSIQVTPDFSYFQDDSSYLNLNYQSNYEGGYLQPKKDKYKSNKFQELFNPRNGEATSNKQLFEAYKALKDLQRNNLDIMGELGSHNLYKLPQISKTNLEKLNSLVNRFSWDRINEILRDFSFYRIDELERGADFNGQNSKIIPKYYLRDLESSDDLSRQLFQSYTAFTQQAHLHRARRNNIGDMFAIREKLLNNERYQDKVAESTRTLKMFNSYMDSNFFGIQEQSTFKINVLGREVDLTKLARKFLNFIKFKNLGFSAIVPATSWLTAEVNTKIEQWVQEHTNTRSGQMAFKEYSKLAPKALKEFANLRSDSKLSVLGEFLGVYDLQNRYENSSYKMAGRWLSFNRLGMGLHQAANFPIIPRIMLSVLYDNRVVDGKIVNYNDFKRAQKRENPEISNKDIDNNWAKYESEAIYDYLDISETTVTWKKDKIAKKLKKADQDNNLVNYSEEELDNYLKNKLYGIQSRIEEATSNIDGSISNHRQVAASRHFLLNYFMTHRNWLTIATSRRFKNNQWNMQTGEQEEGSWVTGYKFLGDYIKELSSKNRKNWRETVQDMWANSDETTRKNLRRLGIDLAVINSMALIGFMLANMADDEDNEDLWSLQLANYLYFRTLNETASSSISLPNQYLETLDSPFVGLNTVHEIMQAYKVFDFDPVLSGKYKDKTVAGRQLLKMIPGLKQARELRDPKGAADTYRFYNDPNFNYIPLYNFLYE